MTREPNPILVRAVQLLADGEWHDFDGVLRELARLVPPGPAIRRVERNRRQAVRRQHGPLADPADYPRRYPLDVERQIESGKRAIAHDVFRAPGGPAGANPIFETDGSGPRGRGGRVRLRRVPKHVAEYVRNPSSETG